MVKTNVLFAILNIFISIRYVKSNVTVSNIIGSSRKKLEGIVETTTLKAVVDDAQSDLVAEFFEHVKEIFESDGPNTTYNMKHKFTLNNPSTTSSKTKMMRFLDKSTTKQSTIKRTTSKRLPKTPAKFKNITLASPIYSTFVLPKHNNEIVMTYKIMQSTRSCPKETTTVKSNYRKYYNKKTKSTTATYTEEDDLKDSSMGPISEDNEQDLNLMDQSMKSKLSCILCDNVSNKDCNDPKNKLLPLIRCERDGDICYSLHTPFGIVDRGCYNPVLNHSTYVCSCNLCNSIPIHELPHTFTKRSDWHFNVQELSHGRRLRKSVYSQMSCIQCEVNQTVDEVPDINCLEGKYRVLPSQYCDSDEICGIRSIKSEGYIWRGCIKNPRYNYFWNFCNYDLCNFDVPVSVFDSD